MYVNNGINLKVINFWKDLDWPDREQSVGYFATIIQVWVGVVSES